MRGRKPMAKSLSSQYADDMSVDDIHNLISRGRLKEAQQAYAQTYHQRHDSKDIDKEIEDCLKQWLDLPADWEPGFGPIPSRVKVPPELLLALVLREGFARRHHGHQPDIYQQAIDMRYIREFRELRDEIIAEFKGETRLTWRSKFIRKSFPELIDAAAKWKAQGKTLKWVRDEATNKAAETISKLSDMSKAKILEGRPYRQRKRHKKQRAQIAE
jgi:hypothetical protein